MESSYLEVPNIAGRPFWYRPNNSRHDILLVRNSLTDRLEEFAVHEGNRVRWYNCGPTVYNVCHMGHARAYVTLDILRRIMVDYLRYDVEYQINITDVDDKIIVCARRNLLIDQYLAGKPSAQEILLRVTGTIANRITNIEEKITKIQLENTSNSRRTNELEEQYHHELWLWKSREGTLLFECADVTNVDKIFRACAASEALGISLDEERGSIVFDNEIFQQHARKYEELFMRDMQRLGVRPPDVYTRTTEYIPKIIDFCARLVELEFAYEINGSIYLDTKSLEKAGHSYRKLKPLVSVTATTEFEGEEGSLCGNPIEKRDPKRDFVLWQRREENTGEPGWQSPWGRGRPGWHIECSVVASDILGPHIDIHTGGEDLKFPHHDNELAQSEAFHQCKQWVNYFLHVGPLQFKGLKMSKSSKNFLTIEEALLISTPRTLRMLFLIQPWDGPSIYSDMLLEDVRSKEKIFTEFLGEIIMMEKDFIHTWLKREINSPSVNENKFREILMTNKQHCHFAILNNFNTPTCVECLLKIVSAFYEYKIEATEAIAFPVCLDAGRYVKQMLSVFGVNFSECKGLD